MQQVELGSIAIGDVDGLNAKDITAGDQAVRSPRFSPDGGTIAYVGDDPDPIKPASSVYLIDRDGRNRRQLARSKDFIAYPSWSPDGRNIAYPYRDSVWKTAVVDVRDPNNRKDFGPGYVNGWLDGGMAVNIARAGSSWRVPLDGGAREKISKDSTRVIFSPFGEGEVMRDRRGGKTPRDRYAGEFCGIRMARDWCSQSREAWCRCRWRLGAPCRTRGRILKQYTSTISAPTGNRHSL
jgi:dipeptidyl aminopeptidase/acylaminoacyl peptidase